MPQTLFSLWVTESHNLSFGWALGLCGHVCLAAPLTTGGILCHLAGAVGALAFYKAYTGPWKVCVGSCTSPGGHLVPRGHTCRIAKAG